MSEVDCEYCHDLSLFEIFLEQAATTYELRAQELEEAGELGQSFAFFKAADAYRHSQQVLQEVLSLNHEQAERRKQDPDFVKEAPASPTLPESRPKDL